MRNMLLLRQNAHSGWSWMHLDNAGVARGIVTTGSLAEAAIEASGLRVLVLLPGTDCLLTSVRIPGRNRKKMLQAVPYALEERLSEDVENLHFAIGSIQEDGSWQVAVVNKHRIETLLATLREAGFDVQHVLPEQLAVPLPAAGGSSVLLDRDNAVVRDSEHSGYAIDCDNLGMILADRMQGAEEAAPALRIYMEQDTSPPELGDYRGEVAFEHYANDPLAVLSQGLDLGTVNLLQGEYSLSGEWQRVLSPWKSTAALLLIGFLVSNAVMAVDYMRLKRESDQLKTEIEQTFRKALPDTRRLVNPRVQMQQKLDELQNRQGNESSFLVLLGLAGTVIKDMNGVAITGANYRGGRLDLDLDVSSLQLLDQLKQALVKNNDLSVEIQSATTGADQKVNSRLRITGVES